MNRFPLLKDSEQPELHAQFLATEKNVIAAGMHCVYLHLSRSAVVGQPDGHRQGHSGHLKVVSTGKAQYCNLHAQQHMQTGKMVALITCCR